MENKTPFGFYYIDRDYIDAMRTTENPHVPNANYEDEGRARKFYCGPVMNQDGVDFYVPISHEVLNIMECHFAAKPVKKQGVSISNI